MSTHYLMNKSKSFNQVIVPGTILIAKPIQVQEYLNKAVILILNKTETGMGGLILNRVTPVPLEQCAPSLESIKQPIFYGGPVSNHLIFHLHNYSFLRESKQIVADIYNGGDYDHLVELVHNRSVNPALVRFFSGYLGWETGELEDELRSNNSWWVNKCSYTLDELFSIPYFDMWKHLALKNNIILGLFSELDDPSLN